jgi:hypothetical protein
MTRGRRLILAGLAAVSLLSSVVASFAQVPAPVPALPDAERRTAYSITSSQCNCSVNFALFGDTNDFQNWVEVYLNGTLVSFNDPLSGWTITSPSGPLGNIARPITDGVLTFNSAQTGTIQIVGARRPRRVSQFSENAGVSARNLNQVITDIVAMLREVWDKINDVTGRVVRAPPGETLNTLPPAASRASKGACFDSGGNLIPCVITSSGSIAAGNGISVTGSNPATISANLTGVFPIVVTPGASDSIGCPTCNTSPIGAAVVASRTAAIALNLSAFSAITVQGYSTSGDGGRADFVKVASQPFCGPYADTAAFQDAGGNWWDIAEPVEYNIKQFGAKMDSIFGISGTDDTAAVLSAVRCAGVLTGAGDDVGGGAGKIVRVPAGWSLISSTVTIPNQVPVIGVCPICNGFVMSQSFATNAHFFILGDQFTGVDVCQTQSRGSAGNLVLNGNLTRGGVATPLYPVVPQINSVSNDSGVNFTFTGTDRYGNSQTETIAGPNAGTVSSSKFWKTITQVATSGATVGSVSVGFPQIATFGTRLQDLQLFSGNINATNFVTVINESGVTGHSGNGMVYTNSAQHTAGVKNVKVFAGDRMAFFFEVGVGGAATVTLQDIESFNAGNCGGCAANNPQAYFNYAGLGFPVSNYVIGGPGAAGGSSTAVVIDGGWVDWSGGHCEGVAICVLMDATNINNGNLTIKNLVGSPTVTDMLKINTGSPANITYAQGLWPNGATHTVNNQGTPVTGNVIPWTLY